MSSKSFGASSTVSSTVSSRHQPSRGSRSSGSSLLEAPEALGAAMRGPRGSGSGYLEAPEALGAAISRLQRLWERPSRRSRGSKSTHREAPEAPRAPISRLPRLGERPSRGSRGSGCSHLEAPEALEAQVAPTSVLSSFLDYSRAWRPLGELSQRLREARGGFRRLRAGSRGLPGGFEWLRERSEVASRRVKRLGVASRALEEPPRPTATQRKASQANSKVLSTASSMD